MEFVVPKDFYKHKFDFVLKSSKIKDSKDLTKLKHFLNKS